jgi:hypothetical protein
MAVIGAVALVLTLPAAASAASMVLVDCPEGPYHVRPFRMTIDTGTNAVEVPDHVELSPEPVGAPKITSATIEWSFMRGWVVFHRDTHVLEWDASAEYDYLDAIGHTPDEPRSSFAGKSQCTVDR